MLRGSRLFKSAPTLFKIRGSFTSLPVSSTTIFARLQHTESSETVSKTTNSQKEAKNPPRKSKLIEVTPEVLEQRRLRDERFKESSKELSAAIATEYEAGKSARELSELFFGTIDKNPFLKDRFHAIQAFSNTINTIITRSIEEIADPNQTRIPLSPQDIINKAAFYGVAHPTNFELAANDYLKQGEPQNVLPLWVSYIEYKSSQGRKFYPGEGDFVKSTIIAYAELTAGKNPELENIRQLLQIDALPGLYPIFAQLDKVLPKSNERYKSIKNTLSQLMLASRDPNTITDLARAYAAAGRGDFPSVIRIFSDAKHISELSGTPLSQETLVAFMTCFNLTNHPSEVFEIWNQILKSGTKPTTDAWNQLLDASAKSGPFSNRIGQAHGILSKIPNPNEETSAKLYSIYLKYQEPELAKELLTKENLKSSVFVNTYLRALSTDSDIENLLQQLRRFQNEGIKIKVETYNKILSRLVSSMEFSRAKRLLNEMEAHFVKPDVATFSIILDLTLKSITSRGEIPTEKTIDDCLSTMKEAGIEINNFTITSIMDGLGKDASSYGLAEVLFNNLEIKNKINPVAYVSMISNAFSIGKTDLAEKYFQKLSKSIYGINQPNWAMMFEGWSKNKNVEKAKEYLQKVEALPDFPKQLNKYSYYYLFQLANDQNSIELATETFKILDEYNLASKILSQQTKRVISNLLRKGFPVPESVQKTLPKREALYQASN
jgi:pentatricopeptide repeat protein